MWGYADNGGSRTSIVLALRHVLIRLSFFVVLFHLPFSFFIIPFHFMFFILYHSFHFPVFIVPFRFPFFIVPFHTSRHREFTYPFFYPITRSLNVR